MNGMQKTLTKHSIEHITSPANECGPIENALLSPTKKIKTEPPTTSTGNNNNNNIYPEMKKITSTGTSAGKIVSYTEMIARAIFSCPNNMSTLQDIYNYLSVKYPVLQNRGKSWKNSVRHTLSLNEWFVKIPRMDNGKCCYWSVHPVYLQRFKKGDFQKQRKSNACKLRNATRTLEELQYNMNNTCHMAAYYPAEVPNNYYHSLPSWPVCRNVDGIQQSYYNVPASAVYPAHLQYAQTPLEVPSQYENPMMSLMTSYPQLKHEKLIGADMCKQPFTEASYNPSCSRSPNPEHLYHNNNNHGNHNNNRNSHLQDGLRYNNGTFSPNMPVSPSISPSISPSMVDPLSPVATVNELHHLQMQVRMENAI